MPQRILLVEDNPRDVSILINQLTKISPKQVK